MIKTCKIRMYPNSKKIKLINNTLGCCNWIKNKYLEINIMRYNEGKSFISAYDFSKYINHLKKTNPDYYWLKEYSSKAIQSAMQEKEKAYKSFFKNKKGFPRFKSRKRLTKESFFFVKNNIHYISKNIIKLPILGKVRITENDYLPDIKSISSGRVIRENNKYYVMFIYETSDNRIKTTSEKLGIDVGVKNYVSISSNKRDYMTVKHFKDDEKYKELEDKITRLQRIISHKVEINYGILLNGYLDKYHEEPKENTKNIMKGESYNTSQIRKLQKKIKSLKCKQANIRKDFINKLVNCITARIKPRQITIENLDVSKMIKHNGAKDTTLHKYISESSFYTFKLKLINKCMEYGINLRVANKYFASSKICSCCDNKKESLTLTDRIYRCDNCGLEIDRDLNAAINLLNLKDKKCLVYKFA